MTRGSPVKDFHGTIRTMVPSADIPEEVLDRVLTLHRKRRLTPSRYGLPGCAALAFYLAKIYSKKRLNTVYFTNQLGMKCRALHEAMSRVRKDRRVWSYLQALSPVDLYTDYSLDVPAVMNYHETYDIVAYSTIVKRTPWWNLVVLCRDKEAGVSFLTITKNMLVKGKWKKKSHYNIGVPEQLPRLLNALDAMYYHWSAFLSEEAEKMTERGVRSDLRDLISVSREDSKGRVIPYYWNYVIQKYILLEKIGRWWYAVSIQVNPKDGRSYLIISNNRIRKTRRVKGYDGLLKPWRAEERYKVRNPAHLPRLMSALESMYYHWTQLRKTEGKEEDRIRRLVPWRWIREFKVSLKAFMDPDLPEDEVAAFS